MTTDSSPALDVPVAGLLICGHPPSEHSDISTGTCSFHDVEICWGCSHKVELFYLGMEERVSEYLRGWQIVDWPGQVLMRVVSRHPRSNSWCRKPLVHVTAIDQGGNRWYGDGLGDGMYIRLRRAARRRIPESSDRGRPRKKGTA